MKTAWLVDDDEEMARAIKLMLSLMDFDMVHFINARSATQKLLAGPIPDILILDVSMPEVSGMDMLEFVRRRTEWNRLPIVMLSNEFAETQIYAALDMGADAYVTKPATLEDLESAIKDAFRTKGRRRK